MDAEPVVHRLAPFQIDQEAAGDMDIKDIDVFTGVGCEQEASSGERPEPAQGFAQALTKRLILMTVIDADNRGLIHGVYVNMSTRMA